MKRPLSDFTNNRVLVSPSLLASDFSALGAELRKIEEANADMVHLDVMDAHFVPNLTIGPALISALRKHSTLPFDTHLMMTHPLRYIQSFSDSGADHITFHIECSENPAEIIHAIRGTGCSAGVSLKPGTPASALLPVIADVDLVLVMTVEPGFGGQSFMAEMLPKIAEIRRMLDAVSSRAHLEVDGLRLGHLHGGDHGDRPDALRVGDDRRREPVQAGLADHGAAAQADGGDPGPHVDPSSQNRPAPSLIFLATQLASVSSTSPMSD